MQVDRYEEYPKMRELIQRKDNLVAQRATPAFFMQVDYPPCPPCLHTWARPGLKFLILMLLPTQNPSLQGSSISFMHGGLMVAQDGKETPKDFQHTLLRNARIHEKLVEPCRPIYGS